MIGALDQGTSSTRFIIFDDEGSEVARHQVEHQQILPRAGWVEHDPGEIIRRTREAIAGALAAAKTSRGVSSRDLAAIGITNQRETTVVWNPKTGQPWHNAIVWQDTRTAEGVAALEPHAAMLRACTGLPPATYFSAPKLRWILDHIDGVRDAAIRGEAIFGTIDSWLIWNLTGGAGRGRHVTDVTNASRTQLMNLRTLAWDDRLLELFDVPRAMLPIICPSCDASAYGTLMIDGEGTVGGASGREIPIAGVLGDQQAAMLGQACTTPGDAKNTYGTGNFLLLNTGAAIVPSTCGLLTTVCWDLARPRAQDAGISEPGTSRPEADGRRGVARNPRQDDQQHQDGQRHDWQNMPRRLTYALEGSIAVTGSAVQWLRDQLGIIETAADVEALAASVDDAAGAYFVPAFSGLFAPYWRSDARGLISGLTRYHTKAHLARATLEAICFQTRDVLDAMAGDARLHLDVLKVDGGATVNGLLMQLQADVLGVPIVRPVVQETTALGAAYAAGLGVGVWTDVGQLETHWKVDRRWEPRWSEARREAAYSGWKDAVRRCITDRPG